MFGRIACLRRCANAGRAWSTTAAPSAGWPMAPSGLYGMKMLKSYSAITRAGIDDDGFRAADPALRLQDMDRDGVQGR